MMCQHKGDQRLQSQINSNWAPAEETYLDFKIIKNKTQRTLTPPHIQQSYFPSFYTGLKPVKSFLKLITETQVESCLSLWGCDNTQKDWAWIDRPFPQPHPTLSSQAPFFPIGPLLNLPWPRYGISTAGH